jgi:DNA recombination protein RmuC
MSPLVVVVVLVAGALLGAAITAFLEKRIRDALIGQAVAGVSAQVQAAERRREDVVEQLGALRAALAARESERDLARTEITTLRTKEATFATRLDELAKSQSQLKEVFQALSGEALKSNNEQFLQLARTELERIRLTAQAELTEKETAIQSLVTPIREGLERYDTKLHEIETARLASFASLAKEIEGMLGASDVLRGETANLARALRSSNVRGAWGELQLKRAVELAGMLEHCDFDTQATTDGEDGKIRPDMIIHLPGDKTIVVDAKTPATAVLEAVNCQDDARRKELCVAHVASVKKHIEALGKKAYWEQFDNAPEFVVLFLPSEAFFSVALEFDPTLFEHSFEQKVIIATPTTLVALLKSVAFGWRQEAIARNAQAISELGRAMFDRIRTLAEHFDDLGEHLGKSVGAYNRAVGSLESRVLPQARRFQELGAGGAKPIPELTALETAPLKLNAPEMLLPMAPGGDA